MKPDLDIDLLKAFVDVCSLHGVAVTVADVDYYASLIKERLRQAGSLDPSATLH